MSGELPSAVPVADTGTDLGPLALGEGAPESPTPSNRFSEYLHEVLSGSVVLTILAIVA
jgi:hypothetical protein